MNLVRRKSSRAQEESPKNPTMMAPEQWQDASLLCGVLSLPDRRDAWADSYSSPCSLPRGKFPSFKCEAESATGSLPARQKSWLET